MKLMRWLSRYMPGSKGAYHCPLCGGYAKAFLPALTSNRQNIRCPHCNSAPRHRLMWLGFQSLWARGALTQSGRLLHAAPEAILSPKVSRKFDYVSIDLMRKDVTARMDLTALGFADSSFDAVICSHVLEHIPNDRKAISELYRVLKPGGWACVQVPMRGQKTDEDLSLTDEQERLKRFGHKNHVRLYGRRDYSKLLRGEGFTTRFIEASEFAEPSKLHAMSIKPNLCLMLVTK